ncbi:MAG: YvcK family protein [Chloroflexi bacterium]|nr:YvcK family protein [Chloroflexota bacterium]
MLKRRIVLFLRPGIGLKRWLAILAAGILCFGLGLGFALATPVSPKVLPLFRAVTLSGLPAVPRGAVFIGIGTALSGLALWQVYRLIISGATAGRRKVDMLASLERQRKQGRGLRVVAIGGGTGLATLLRGLKYETGNLTAIVAITDDGGSSGRLRRDLRIPPPGDVRNCLVALSEAEPLVESLFNYRFDGSSSLGGHSLGNLLIAALYELGGGFEQSLQLAREFLPIVGQVVPASSEANLVLMGETVSGQVLRGESAIGHAPDRLRRVWIEPHGAASATALEAIRQAELIVIGPGSLYTSIIPNFLLAGLREAVAASPAPKVFVCNVATQPHETDAFGPSDHLRVFLDHTGAAVTHLLVNSRALPLPKGCGQTLVIGEPSIPGFHGTVVLADVIDESFPTRHDPRKLASALLDLARSSRRGVLQTA